MQLINCYCCCADKFTNIWGNHDIRVELSLVLPMINLHYYIFTNIIIKITQARVLA